MYSKRALGIELVAPTSRHLDNWISIGNIHRDLRDASDMPLENEVRECFHILQSRGINQRRARRLANSGPQGCLSEHSVSFSHIANMNVFISSMEDFASINAVYATYFGVSPPARACVAVDLPHPLRVTLDCTIYAEQKADDRKALHVQGMSYWAPANIGPYSQAIVVSESKSFFQRREEPPSERAVDTTYDDIPNLGKRTRFRLGTDWPRSQLHEHAVAPKSRH
jgi:diphthine-ammonia ligase